MDPAKSGEDPDPVRIGDFLPAGCGTFFIGSDMYISSYIFIYVYIYILYAYLIYKFIYIHFELRSNPDLDPQHCLLGMDLARVISG